MSQSPFRYALGRSPIPYNTTGFLAAYKSALAGTITKLLEAHLQISLHFYSTLLSPSFDIINLMSLICNFLLLL
jgi:hypothetical protein